MTTHVTFESTSEVDRDIFELLLLDAADDSSPAYIGDIRYPATMFETWCAEGRMRAAVNAKLRGSSWSAKDQRTPGSTLTVDELGRTCEGAIETMLGLDVAAVLHDGTDDRPDKTLNGVKFDVKGSLVRPGNTFAIPCWQALSKGYDALILSQHVEPGLARVWCCACKPVGASAWQYMQGVRGKKPFYRIACPQPASAEEASPLAHNAG